jgi:glutamyl-tRNA reductase
MEIPIQAFVEAAVPKVAECMAPHGGLDELIILGVTHKSAASMEQLSSLVISEDQQDLLLSELKEVLDAEELVYVSTCNRASFIIISRRQPMVLFKVLRSWFIARDPKTEVPEADQWVILQGKPALEHLLLVASSLDSMVVGERQILGQFKQAFIHARALGVSGSKMHFLYEQILTVAKQVYTNTSLSEGKLSVASLAEERLEEFCSKRRNVKAMLVGAGKMIDHIGAFLSQRPGVDLVFVNRTKEKSDALCERFGGVSLSLESLLSERPNFDILATSTSAPHYLFGTGFFTSGGEREDRLAIDLAIPPDVDPAVGELPGVTLVNMDSLRDASRTHQKKRKDSAQEARRILDEGIESIVDNWKVRMINPVIGAIRHRYEKEGVELLAKLLEEDLPHLNKSEREILERWTRNMAKRWAVIHASGVRQVARKCCMKAVETYLNGAGVERDES